VANEKPYSLPLGGNVFTRYAICYLSTHANNFFMQDSMQRVCILHELSRVYVYRRSMLRVSCAYTILCVPDSP
jgi:hypothetical protein